MPQVTNTDIRELKDLIQGLDRKMEKGFSNADSKMDLGFSNADSKIDLGFADLKGQINTLETKLDGKIDTVNSRLTNLEANTKVIADLTEKVGELKNWKQIAIIVFTASVSGAIAWFVRGGVKP
jgi:hypothetical protein